ncbi:MAG: hypothetical protein ACI9G9_000892 [Psychromonas sp.]|jgi:hypothetical protein
MKISTSKILQFLFCLAMILGTNSVWSQVKIGDNPATINSNSLLELEATDKALVIPRVSITLISGFAPLVSTPITGALVYNTNATSPLVEGFYYWGGAAWALLSTANQEPLIDVATGLGADNTSTQLQMPAYVENAYYTNGLSAATNMLAVESNGNIVQLPNLALTAYSTTVTSSFSANDTYTAVPITTGAPITGASIVTDKYKGSKVVVVNDAYEAPYTGFYSISFNLFSNGGNAVTGVATMDVSKGTGGDESSHSTTNPPISVLGTDQTFFFSSIKYYEKGDEIKFFVRPDATRVFSSGSINIICVAAF